MCRCASESKERRTFEWRRSVFSAAAAAAIAGSPSSSLCSSRASIRRVSTCNNACSAHCHTISCGVASATRCRSVSRWRVQIQSPTATPGLSSAVAWSKYCWTTYCRPPQPLRVGEYRTLHSAAEHVSMRLGITGHNGSHPQSAQRQRTRCERHFHLLRVCRTLQGPGHSSATAHAMLVVNAYVPLHCAEDEELRDADCAVHCPVLWHTARHHHTGPQRGAAHTHAQSSAARHRLPLKFAQNDCCAKRFSRVVALSMGVRCVWCRQTGSACVRSCLSCFLCQNANARSEFFAQSERLCNATTPQRRVRFKRRLQQRTPGTLRCRTVSTTRLFSNGPKTAETA